MFLRGEMLQFADKLKTVHSGVRVFMGQINIDLNYDSRTWTDVFIILQQVDTTANEALVFFLNVLNLKQY